MKKSVLIGLLAFALLPVFTGSVVPQAAAAETVTPAAGNQNNGNNLPSIDDANDITRIINNITNWMYTIFMAVAVIMIIYAAFLYLTAGGGENVSKAHKVLLYAVVAIAVAMLSRGIVNLVGALIK